MKSLALALLVATSISALGGSMPDSLSNVAPDEDVLRRGVHGFNLLKASGQLNGKDIIVLIDFRKPSSEKRLWVIDMKSNTVLYHSLVAHGKNSGDLYARNFSNTENSLKSSLGFFVTGDLYHGKHGLSLKLKGVERGINDRAESRAIVVHKADYVSEEFVRRVGRLGRSFGCPAIPGESYNEVIEMIKSGACLFIYYPDSNYLSMSAYQVSYESPVSATAAGQE